MGVEQPFEGRLRLASTLRYRSDTIDDIDAREVRWTLAASFSPHRDFTFAAVLPLIWRDADYPDGTRDQANGVGDVELYVRWVAFRDSSFAPRHMISLIGGVELPTGPAELAVRDEAMPGSGTLDFIGGISYSFFTGAAWSGYASFLLSVPTWQRGHIDTGVLVRATAAGQLQAFERLAFRAGPDLRSEKEGGSVFGTATVLWSPVTDWVFTAGVSVPAVRFGSRRDGALFEAGIVLDL